METKRLGYIKSQKKTLKTLQSMPRRYKDSAKRNITFAQKAKQVAFWEENEDCKKNLSASLSLEKKSLHLLFFHFGRKTNPTDPT